MKHTKRTPRGVFKGVPTFFRASCWEASRGGSIGYDLPGWNLAGAIHMEVPYDLEVDDWESEVSGLVKLIKADDRGGIARWFEDHFPNCIKLVPTRRRGQFVDGVVEAYEQGKMHN